MKLYGYWRSSASYRVRIALALKELSYESFSVHLVKDGGEQKLPAYKELNPAQLVPTFIDGDVKLNQSLAIIEYLDQVYPEHRLIPEDPKEAAIVRMLALDMAADLQPITNLRILQYVAGELDAGDEGKVAWIHHWVERAFTAFEARLQKTAGRCCFGDQVTLADICLVPQVYNAQRFGVDLSAYPKLMAVNDYVCSLPAFQQARPEAQPDAQ
ncbi:MULTISPECIES: maleylacetoacetate isomerase [Gammaproteobacteria]|uniref:maleylacetoacetate isomerase n=1 Tax=Gammaproteobacteria TaxID=1236 RepID=UPI000DD02894|nr:MULTISPECIES: maleylacetoacetate isomerase [Gammaproteobacteria]RTE87148.1 maleylacetoacetate isomerase [Aliidiomarina sp. B3213]TCZ93064.1 maleylacetoacetate isomerase [Lysobacter sp. N42]